jgi:hypothetical protein
MFAATAAALLIAAASAIFIIQARSRTDIPDFPELVGCRLKYVLRIDPAAHTPKEVSLPANSHLAIEWADDKGAQPTDYRFAFRPQAPAPPGEPAWKSLKPGDYRLTVTAMRGDAQIAAQDIALHVTVVPDAQIFVNDYQEDGVIRFQAAFQWVNRQNTPIETGQWGAGTMMIVEKVIDDGGHEIPFFPMWPQDGMCRFYYRLNEPVAPGETVLQRQEGVMVDAIRDIGDGLRRHESVHSPAIVAPVRRIEIHRLPAGAQLISTTPANLPTRTFAGRTEVLFDQTIPLRGTLRLRIDYRLAQSSPTLTTK